MTSKKDLEEFGLVERKLDIKFSDKAIKSPLGFIDQFVDAIERTGSFEFRTTHGATVRVRRTAHSVGWHHIYARATLPDGTPVEPNEREFEPENLRNFAASMWKFYRNTEI